VKRFRGGLAFKAHRLCVSLTSRLESNKEEEEVWTLRQVPASESTAAKVDKPKVDKPKVDRLRIGWPLWEGNHESRRCSRDTYPESYITKYTSIRNERVGLTLKRLQAARLNRDWILLFNSYWNWSRYALPRYIWAEQGPVAFWVEALLHSRCRS